MDDDFEVLGWYDLDDPKHDQDDYEYQQARAELLTLITPPLYTSKPLYE